MASPRRLDGKVAVITAATEGIGFAIAKRLAEDGAFVIISSRKQSNVDKALAELHRTGLTNVLGITCHVGKREDRIKLIDFAIKSHGTIDVLVSNAAVSPVMSMALDTSEEAWDKIFDVNLKASWQLTQLVAPIMMKAGSGSIVYISSIGAYNHAPPIAIYSVSKTALLGLTKVVASQLAPMGIRVNCVCPGVIETKLSEPLIASESAREEVLRNIPMGRVGVPAEVAGIVSFLASKDSSYLTGESIAVGGGVLTRL